MEGQAVLHVARPRHLRAGRAGPLRPGRAALLHLRRRSGEPGHRLHLGRVRPAQQLRARRRLGQPGQPHRDDDRQELRRDPAARHAGSRSTRRCSTVSQRASTPSATSSSGTASGRRSPRRCGSSARSTSTSPRPSRTSSRDPTSASGSATVLHVLAQAVSDCNTLLSPFLPHAANRVHRGARRRGRPGADARSYGTSRTSTADRHYPVITGDYSATPPWRSRPVVAGHAGRQADARSSPSSTRRWSSEEIDRMRAEA